MSKKKYLVPQISIIMFEPQAILAGSGGGESNVPASGGITYSDGVESGDEEDIWDTTN